MRRRRPWGATKWVAAALGALVVLWVGVATVRLVRAAQFVHRGTGAVAQARSRLDVESIESASPVGPVDAAAADFRRAHELTSGAVITPFRYLPVIGRQIRSVAALSGSAERVATVGHRALVEARAVLQAPRSTGVDRVTLLRRMGLLASRTDASLGGLDLGPRRDLIRPLASRRNEFASELDKLRTTLKRTGAAADGLADLLGGRSYLLLAGNNAEM